MATHPMGKVRGIDTNAVLLTENPAKRPTGWSIRVTDDEGVRYWYNKPLTEYQARGIIDRIKSARAATVKDTELWRPIDASGDETAKEGQFASLLVFRPEVTADEARKALAAISHLLVDKAVLNDYNPEHGQPVFYIP